MSEMIERVGLAIEAAIPEGSFGWSTDADGTMHLEGKVSRVTLARAAIEAMREPTEDVLREGADKMRYGKQVVPPHHAKFVWQAMIDAALAQ